MSDVVSFAGREFHIAGRVGLMPLMRFAKIAKSGADSNDSEGLVAMYDLLEQCIVADEWDSFVDAAIKSKAQPDEFWGVVRETMAVLTRRPTSRPSDSSDGPMTTETSSEPVSDSVAEGAEDYLRVVRRLEAEGRPDKALQVLRAHEEMTQTSAV